MGMPGEKYSGALRGGTQRGEREIVIYLPYRQRGKKGIFIEFRGGDSPALLRSKWLKYVREAGYRVCTCQTLEELEQIIQTLTQGGNP